MQRLSFIFKKWNRAFALLALLSLILGVGAASAQTPLSNLVFTVGTTAHYGSQDWSYVVMGSQDSSVFSGRQFVVYSKSGYPADPGTYVLRGTMARQTDPTTINGLLNQSLALGEDLASLSNSLNVALHSVAGITNLALPQKVLTLLNLSVTDVSSMQIVALLSRTHPGLGLCAGQAFSEVIGSVTTYEVREVNPSTGLAGDVLGRVTIIPGNPLILPAPGYPFQISSNTSLDHLRIRLRWGTPPELRRLALMSYGFNVWRIPKAVATSLGLDVTPPQPDAALCQCHAGQRITCAGQQGF